MKRIAFLLTCIVCFLNTPFTWAKMFNDSLPSGKNYDKAAFRLWYPDNIPHIKGILVLMPGSSEDGRPSAEDPFWQDFAKRNNLALLGCFFTDLPHQNMDVEEYANVKDGSGQALLNILASFAKTTGKSELENAPLLLWGHSAGGEFNYEFASWKPERVIAFVVNKGGIYFSALAPASTQKIPGLFIVGENDIAFRNNVILGIFSINRRFGAIWTFAQEPGMGHAIGRTRELAVVFFNEALAVRLLNAPATGSAVLSEVKEKSGFVGEIKSADFIPALGWPPTSYPTAWLISAKFAEAWAAFSKGKPF